ncbi:hypothetical protein HDU96_002528, partial [Phlyctochytrium bullatum]
MQHGVENIKAAGGNVHILDDDMRSMDSNGHDSLQGAMLITHQDGRQVKKRIPYNSPLEDSTENEPKGAGDKSSNRVNTPTMKTQLVVKKAKTGDFSVLSETLSSTSDDTDIPPTTEAPTHQY